MDHEEMMSNAVAAAKESKPLTVADGVAILNMIGALAELTSTLLDDEAEQAEVYSISAEANELVRLLRTR